MRTTRVLRRSVAGTGAAVMGILLFACVLPGPVRAAATPAATVERLHTTLIEVMQSAESLKFTGRRLLLSPVVRESFDFAFISRIVLGRYWGDLSDADRQRMIDTFTELTIATYASRFDGYSGEKFQVVEVTSMSQGRMLVRTELVRPGKDTVQLDYVLQEENGQWLIVNVVANGVSDLSLKRADYGSIMKSQGFDTLISRLQGQITELGGG